MQHRSRPSILGHVVKGRPKGGIYAEKKMAMLLATSNIPFTFVDVFNTSMKDMFPDGTGIPNSELIENIIF